MEGTQERDVYLTTVGSIRTDFSEKHSYLNALQFNYDGTLIATGGTDSVVRIWKVLEIIIIQKHTNWLLNAVACVKYVLIQLLYNNYHSLILYHIF